MGVKMGCALSLIIMLECTCVSMVLLTDMLQHLHLQMLCIFTKRLKVSTICGSQNMNSIMRYGMFYTKMGLVDFIL